MKLRLLVTLLLRQHWGGEAREDSGYGRIGGAPKHASAFLVLPSGSMKPPVILSIETENTAASWALPELEACFEELEHFAFVVKEARKVFTHGNDSWKNREEDQRLGCWHTSKHVSFQQ